MSKKNFRTKGVRIRDKKDRVVQVHLPDILEEIKDPESYFWSIMFMQVFRYYGPEPCIADLQEEAFESKCGLILSYDRLSAIAKDATQFEDLVLIGCKNKDKLIRQEEDIDQYENSDFYIEMIDSGYWEVFSTDFAFIDQLMQKFKDTEPLSPDYQDKE